MFTIQCKPFFHEISLHMKNCTRVHNLLCRQRLKNIVTVFFKVIQRGHKDPSYLLNMVVGLTPYFPFSSQHTVFRILKSDVLN